MRDIGSAIGSAIGCVANALRPRSRGSEPVPKEDVAAALDDTVHFREVEGDDNKGINLEARERFRHHQLNQFRDFCKDFDRELPKIENPTIKKLFVAVKEFLDEMVKRGYTDLEGNPLVYNVLSLPLGLSAEAKVIAVLYNYITLEEGLPIIGSCKENGYMAERTDKTVRCNTIEIARRALGDEYFFSFVVGDVHPVAYPHDSTLAKFVGKEVADAIMEEWKKVLSILFNDEDVKIGL